MPTARPQLGFGLFIPAAGKSLQQLIDEFQMAEDLGFDHAWLPDHVKDPDGPPTEAMHETWTVLTAIAARTSRIRLGPLVSSNTFRHPVMLLKQAVTVDHVSAGRLVLGIGTGWFEEEHRRFGIDFPSAVERVDRLEEAVQIIRLLMDEGHGSFQGRYYRLDDAYLAPPAAPAAADPVAHRGPPTADAGHRGALRRPVGHVRGDARRRDRGRERGRRRAARPDSTRRAGRSAVTPPPSAAPSGPAATPSARRRRTSTSSNGVARAGFTDFSVDGPRADDWPMVRRIAEDVLPGLRAA